MQAAGCGVSAATSRTLLASSPSPCRDTLSLYLGAADPGAMHGHLSGRHLPPPQNNHEPIAGIHTPMEHPMELRDPPGVRGPSAQPALDAQGCTAPLAGVGAPESAASSVARCPVPTVLFTTLPFPSLQQRQQGWKAAREGDPRSATRHPLPPGTGIGEGELAHPLLQEAARFQPPLKSN